jgi:hypothetical protein
MLNHFAFKLQAAPAAPLRRKPRLSNEAGMRAVLFVDQARLQRSLGHELACLGFDVILPVTLDEARRSLQPSLRTPDLLVMDLRGAEDGPMELLNVIAAATPRMPVVLIAEAMNAAAIRRRVAMDGVVVLRNELGSFSGSVRRLCGLTIHGWTAAGHGKTTAGA